MIPNLQVEESGLSVMPKAHTPVMCNEVLAVLTSGLTGQGLDAFSLAGPGGGCPSNGWQNKSLESRTCQALGQGPAQTLSFVDATFGRGGHTRALLETFKDSSVTAFDRDLQAVDSAQDMQAQYPGRLRVIHSCFSQIDKWVEPGSVHAVMMDFGVSSPQLDQAHRGFSFQQDGPLDMRMDTSCGPTAADLVNSLPENQLADLLFTYGQERASRRLARAIGHDRQTTPFTTTRQLAGMIERVLGRKGRLHPATRTFQALRIAVNQELAEIEKALPLAAQCLRPAGLLVTIAFHSLEDRLAKTFFKTWPDFDLYTKKPLSPTPYEMENNPRARSSCLRFGRHKI
jgi:16S rRNA (cytosine1402-N4)-methyltransferase